MAHSSSTKHTHTHPTPHTHSLSTGPARKSGATVKDISERSCLSRKQSSEYWVISREKQGRLAHACHEHILSVALTLGLWAVKASSLVANTFSIQVKLPQTNASVKTPRPCFAVEVRKGLVKQPLPQREVTSYPLTPWDRRSKSTSGWSHASVLRDQVIHCFCYSRQHLRISPHSLSLEGSHPPPPGFLQGWSRKTDPQKEDPFNG